MKTRLKILNLIDIPWNSGLTSYALDQARALRGYGHEVHFACPDGSFAGDFAGREGFPRVSLPDRKTPFLRLPFAKMSDFLSAERIDVINAHTGKTQTLAALLSFRPAGKTAVIRTKADARPPSKSFRFMRIAKIIAASDFIRNGYLKAGAPPEKISLARQGIQLAPAELRKPEPPYKIGLLGRLDEVKGHKYFLEAAALVLKSGAKAEFHIAGQEAGIKYSGLEKLAKDLGLGKAAVFHGRVPDSFEFMNSCDIGVIPSLGSEAVSRAALEWLSAAKPLVASRVGSLNEFATPENLVPPAESAALARRLEALLAAPELLNAHGSANRARAATVFSPDIFARLTNAAFESAAKELRA